MLISAKQHFQDKLHQSVAKNQIDRWILFMFQSDQEELLHRISSASFGSGFMFCPLVVRKNREPSDIAWVGDRTAILFYCKSGNKKRYKQDKSNLRQATWWINHWTDDIRLSGYVSDNLISFKRSDIDNIYLCIINDAPNDDLMYIAQSPMKGVKSLCSITARFFLTYQSFFPNVYDFIDFMESNLGVGGGLREHEAINILHHSFFDIFSSGIKAISSDLVLPDDRLRDLPIDDIVQNLKEDFPEILKENLDLSSADVAWISGALHMGTFDIVESLASLNQMKWAWAMTSIRDRKLIVLVTASLVGSDLIFKEVLSKIDSNNFILLHRFGILPDFPNVWTHAVGHSLGPDSRSLDNPN